MTKFNGEIFAALVSRKSEQEAYKMGSDCAASGPNTTNCDFRLFATPAHAKAWERGKSEAESVTSERLQ